MEELNIPTRCYDLTAMDEASRHKVYEEAGAVIRAGGTVVFPTETVYGLGANAMDPLAVQGIYRAKGRPSDNPLIIHVADRDLSGIVSEIPPTAVRLMDRYWPGPLTIIMKKDPGVPAQTTGGLDTVGVRMPDQPAALALIKAAGCGIAAPSANISGRPSPTTFRRCQEDLMGRVDLILGMDQSRVGLESTIIDLSGTVPELLRPGAITLEELRAVLGEVVYVPSATLQGDESPRAPGMKYRHYAPRAKVTLLRGTRQAVQLYLQTRKDEQTLAVLIDADGLDQNPTTSSSGTVFEPDAADSDPSVVRFGSVTEAAREIFETLRWADDQGYTGIWVEAVAETGLGLSLMNRLKKAAAYDVVEVKE